VTKRRQGRVPSCAPTLNQARGACPGGIRGGSIPPSPHPAEIGSRKRGWGEGRVRGRVPLVTEPARSVVEGRGGGAAWMTVDWPLPPSTVVTDSHSSRLVLQSSR